MSGDGSPPGHPTFHSHYTDTEISTERPLGMMALMKEGLRVKHANYSNAAISLSSSTSFSSKSSPGAGGGYQQVSPKPVTVLRALLYIVVLHPMSILLCAWPVGFFAFHQGWKSELTFLFNFLALIPLAKILGDATEELAAGLKNPTVGGLLNATFGNAVEMILMVQTLRAGQIAVVKGTLLGSILSNLLLVLGMSFFLGGITGKRCFGKEQFFSRTTALTNMTMLFVASCSFALPTIFFSARQLEEGNIFVLRHWIPPTFESQDLVLRISRWCSVYILCTYVAYLIYELYTHAETTQEGEEEEEEEEASLPVWVAILLLLVTTIFVAASSEWLVDSIDGVVEAFPIGHVFIGVILLPIVGNACEHAGAVRMAIADKVDITIGIAIGSSTQIGLFVVPVSVMVGWVMDKPMDLNFGPLDTSVMIFAVVITFSIVADAASNWFEGFMLMVAYGIIATLYWFFPDPSSPAEL